MSAPRPINGAALPLLDRAAFLGKPATVAAEPVDVPALGGQVYVRVFSGHVRDTYDMEGARQRQAGQWNLRALMVVLGACDADGVPLFTLADLDAVGQMDWRVLDPVADRVDRLNGLSGVAAEAMVKNSPGEPTSASGSSSPAI